ncbi:MAG: ThiF family adenylyltransferase [Candidatus Heimdallarchaeaceae archaeon]
MNATKELQITIVGLGGVGSILSQSLARFINYSEIVAEFLLIDGDKYEPKNFERQEFIDLGDKAEIKYLELTSKFNRITFDYIPEYLTEDNIPEYLNEGDIIFICVDNHKTRNLINSYAQTLKNVTVISGGNEFTDGNVQIYIRKGGVDLTPNLCAYHPEIESPEDKLPTELSCEQLAQSDPQLYFTNMGVSTIMCWAFYNSVVKQQLERSEIYFDITQMEANAKIRTIVQKTTEGD